MEGNKLGDKHHIKNEGGPSSSAIQVCLPLKRQERWLNGLPDPSCGNDGNVYLLNSPCGVGQGLIDVFRLQVWI